MAELTDDPRDRPASATPAAANARATGSYAELRHAQAEVAAPAAQAQARAVPPIRRACSAPRSTTTSTPRGGSRLGARRVAGLRRADRGRRPARGRDRPRPRLRRRRRRPDLRRPGRPTGKAIGLDMTDEMLALARANAPHAGVENVEFIKGYLEDMPLPDASIDVVISNCVINLSGDKPKVDRAKPRASCARAAGSRLRRDRRPRHGRATRADMAAWTGCIAGALTEAEFRAVAEPRPASRTSRSGPPTASTNTPSAAIIRARKPDPHAAATPTPKRPAVRQTRGPNAAASLRPLAHVDASHRQARGPAELPPRRRTRSEPDSASWLTRFSSTTRRPCTGAGRTPGGRHSRSTSRPTGRNGPSSLPNSANCSCSPCHR